MKTTLVEELEQAADFVDGAAEEERISAVEWGAKSRDPEYRAIAARLRQRAAVVTDQVILERAERYATELMAALGLPPGRTARWVQVAGCLIEFGAVITGSHIPETKEPTR